MRGRLALLVGSLILAAAPASAARLAPEAELEKALEGRVAGEPVRCINLSRVNGTQIIAGTAILYRIGGTIYVNRPAGGARSLDSWDVLVTRTFSSELCSREVVELRDSPRLTPNGMVFLGEFVPYRKAS